MFPYLTRIFWLVAQPMALVMGLLVIGFALGFTKARGWGRALMGAGTLLLFVLGFTTFGYAVITPLEQRFARPAEPAHIDGIVLLGGGMDSEVNSVQHGIELNRSGDRVVEAVRLALRHPEARVVIAAGPTVLAAEQEPEALATARMFTAFGISPDRLVLDGESHNTEENAIFAKALAGDRSGQTWLLVTSAYHMPRSVGLFRAQGFAVIPWPADYLASGAEGWRLKPDQLPENVAVATIALREWAALVGYRLIGKIADLPPGP